MSEEQMIELAERVEKAAADEQRDLIVDAWVAVFGSKTNWHPMIDMVSLGAFLDAAMTLVPEGLDWTLGQSVGFKGRADLWQSGKPPGFRAVAVTPALALTAACLRARAALAGTDT